MQAHFNTKPTAHGLQPDNFDGNPVADALAWLDNFCRIAKLNNWSEELQLNAFPLYLRGIAHARFITLHRKVFKIPIWELNGKFSHYWENKGT